MPPPARYKSTADFVTAEIRRLILSGELPAGARVDQEELADQLEVSRHPVRQAIDRLGERGFVILHPHRSAIVAEISIADMEELYGARRIVEDWAIRESWKRSAPVTEADLEPFFKILDTVDPAADLDTFMAANRDFHLAMYKGCGNRHVLRTITSLFDLSERYQRAALYHSPRQDTSKRDHREMMQAVAAGDRDRLLTLAHSHNDGTQAMVRAHHQITSAG
ncbi:GntR family transcriptional regulator [Bradyrhizobium sp. LHD-71]|jgi:DNA-binding GntR family transcriptional regulator|uniref:GntR family transcriptional regulator n=1 Tax=Bradyrhizobium sp. LHD-71 TaxID=3072141 RepID=UPI00280C8579|nr:GntR family transcriptional regulator [Bradyrhizobium sp. LHD-71]MDQ8732314.1 GntR family transcriptional regulator [Bradyrhizobium sp. LHD-71]